MAEKKCNGCTGIKDIEEFYKDSKKPDGRRLKCKLCDNKRKNEWRANNVDRTHMSILKWTYGLTEEAHAALLEKQGGGCAVCGTKEPGGQGGRFHVDHDHETQTVRGLLCSRCNRGIGYLQDSIKLLQAAISYLKNPPSSLPVVGRVNRPAA